MSKNNQDKRIGEFTSKFSPDGVIEAQTEEEIVKFIKQLLQDQKTCGKELPDGSICNCEKDCHLCDWRQKVAVEDQKKEYIKRLEGKKEDKEEPNNNARVDTLTGEVSMPQQTFNQCIDYWEHTGKQILVQEEIDYLKNN